MDTAVFARGVALLAATYDPLVRVTMRTNPEGTSSFAFDTSAAARKIGSLDARHRADRDQRHERLQAPVQ
jgi:hypothetical protein